MPSLHKRYIEAMVGMFGDTAEHCVAALAPVAASGSAADMENYYSRLGLDIIGKAVFNYDFDSLSKDDPVIRAVYTTLRETEHRSLIPIPYWKLPFANELIPRQVRPRAPPFPPPPHTCRAHVGLRCPRLESWLGGRCARMHKVRSSCLHCPPELVRRVAVSWSTGASLGHVCKVPGSAGSWHSPSYLAAA